MFKVFLLEDKLSSSTFNLSAVVNQEKNRQNKFQNQRYSMNRLKKVIIY